MENEVTLLLFNIMGIDFAMDVDPIEAMLHVESLGNQKTGIVWFHEKINFFQKSVVYHSPKALRITSGDKQFYLIIDTPRDMPVAVPIANIKSFPFLVGKFTKDSPLYGVYLLNEQMIFLVDSFKMCP